MANSTRQLKLMIMTEQRISGDDELKIKIHNPNDLGVLLMIIT